MGEAYFYHLTRHPLEVTLRVLLEKSLERAWRVAVRGRTDALLDRLDQMLWLGDGFLPHGRAGGTHDAQQPVLLTTGEAGNAPRCIVSVEGAEIRADEIAGLERAMILFDGHDEAAKETARAQWKNLTGAGVAAQYWSEESGRWQKAAESKAGT